MFEKEEKLSHEKFKQFLKIYSYWEINVFQNNIVQQITQKQLEMLLKFQKIAVTAFIHFVNI